MWVLALGAIGGSLACPVAGSAASDDCIATRSTPYVPARATTALDIYLSPTGSDTNDGCSSDRPVLTLQRAEAAMEEALNGRQMDVAVKVKGGVYHDQRVRWDFAMPRNTITIEGDRNDRPIFDGSRIDYQAFPRNQTSWINIVRNPRLKPDEGTNIVVRGLQIQNYLEAVWIRGGKTREGGYTNSIGNNTITHNRFLSIGAAFPRVNDPYGFRSSHGAILISGSDSNHIIGNEFKDVTNVPLPSRDYGAYGGLHAIYVTNASGGTIIEGNTFQDILARGVVKFRDFSNFGRVVGNAFVDDTSILLISYCGVEQPACDERKRVECPSWGVEFAGNAIAHFRQDGQARPTLDIERHPQNDSYCSSPQFWQDRNIDRKGAFNQIEGVDRVIQKDNRIGSALRSSGFQTP